MMKKALLIFAVMLTGLALSRGYAFANTSIRTEVDKTCVAPKELLTYKVVIESTRRSIPAPHIPKFTSFKIVSQGQATNIFRHAGKLKTRAEYIFMLLPKKTGRIRIYPARVTIEEKSFTSAPLDIEVTHACSSQGKRKASPGSPQLKEAPGQEEAPESLQGAPDPDQPQYVL
ncbi:MAG: BatD family protein [Candidatus Omnitrophica bacterium]|jgi:hypothetical protein|nr:BatD family protein [Candidatus Omnitrophota bacterium]MDD5078841.1 BatD family protein [Candidatus Omnitrophota bacterium]